MKQLKFCVWMAMMLVVVSGLAQDREKVSDSKRPDGLVKIRSSRNWDFNAQLDDQQLEATIEAALREALRSVESTLQSLEIQIAPIEIDLRHIDSVKQPIVIEIPDLDIDIEPIHLEIPEIDIEPIELGWDDWGAAWDEETEEWKSGMEKNKDLLKSEKEIHQKPDHDQSQKEGKAKTKGLKQIN